jgi:hypothetical protein
VIQTSDGPLPHTNGDRSRDRKDHAVLAGTAITGHLLAFRCSARGDEISPASMVEYPTAHIGRGDGNPRWPRGEVNQARSPRRAVTRAPRIAIVKATSHVSSDPKQQRRIVALGDARPDQLMPDQ